MTALLPDALWIEVEPLIPKRPRSPKGGRPPVEDRQALTGILFVLRTGLPWNMLPQEMGCGSGVTCWRRLNEWTEVGIWPELHGRLLNVLGKAGEIDLSLAVIDSASVRAVFGGGTLAQTPRIVRKTAAKGT